MATLIGVFARGAVCPVDLLLTQQTSVRAVLRFAPVQSTNVALKCQFQRLAQPWVAADARLTIASNFAAGGAAGACTWLALSPLHHHSASALPRLSLWRGLPHAVLFRGVAFGTFDSCAPLTPDDFASHPLRVGVAFCATFAAGLVSRPFAGGAATPIPRLAVQSLPGSLMLSTVDLVFRLRDDAAHAQRMQAMRARLWAQLHQLVAKR